MTKLSDFSRETDKDFAHQYTHVYEGLLGPIRSRVKNVLEVGINTGNSHRMWRDYFSEASIYGVDLYNYCNGMVGEERINVYFCDAYTNKALELFQGIKFDVILDDGPHTLESQEFFVKNYSSLLSDNGILLVEDIPYPEWIQILTKSVPEDLKMYSYGIDRRWVPNKQSINDELIFVIDKRFV